MPLPNGLYKLAVETPTGTDYGVAYLQDGRLRGGDSGMAYVGSYEQIGETFSAELSVTQHRHVPGVVSALGYNDVQVQLDGLVGDNSAQLRASYRDLSSIRFAARLKYVAD